VKAYCDSCIAIYRVEHVEPWYSRIVGTMSRLSSAEIVVTDLVRMECLVGPLKAGNAQGVANFERFFRPITFLPLTRDVFDRAAELRALHNLRTPDAIHVAAALTHGRDEFWTNDNRLAGISGGLQVRVFAS
jgi:predicted nucleic acid-binding protein